MSTKIVPAGVERDVQEIPTEDVASVAWKQHRDLLLHVSIEASGYRGCIGLGLIVDAASNESWLERPRRLFLPDKSVHWASMIDLPSGTFRIGPREREVHWAASFPTRMRYGMPHLCEAGPDRLCWDFRTLPQHRQTFVAKDGYIGVNPDSLSPVDHPQHFRVFNALEWAMSSTAFHYRSSWREQREHLYRALGIEYDPQATILVFGEEFDRMVERPEQWMPKAFLAFNEKSVNRLFERSTKKAMAGPRFIPEEMKAAFVNDMFGGAAYQAQYAGEVTACVRENYHGRSVLKISLRSDDGQIDVIRFSRNAKVHRAKYARFKMGEVIAEETWSLRDDWCAQPVRWRWAQVEDKLHDPETHLRIWFERQFVRLQPGLVHLPSEICALAAAGNAVDSAMYWDVRPSFSYYRDDCDAFIFPTLQIAHWDQFSGVLPGDLYYDFTPTDARFIPPRAKVSKKRAAKRRTRKPAK